MMIELVNQWVRPSVTNEPPTEQDTQRNDIVIVLCFLFALLLGMGLRSQAVNRQERFPLPKTAPAIAHPAGWLTTQLEDGTLIATNPSSASSFDAEISVVTHTLGAEQGLDGARASWALQRGRTLTRYRELYVESVTVLGGQPAMRSTYAYIADPSRESGVLDLPVVVQGQDILFVLNSHDDSEGEAEGEKNGQFMVITMATDAVEWEEELDNFQIVLESLQLKEVNK